MSFEKYTDMSEFFQRWKSLDVNYTRDGLEVGNYKVMYNWEKPLMKEFARVVTETRGDVLEVGYGMGIAAEYIQQFGVKSHTIVEAHTEIFKTALEWKKQKKGNIILINDFWQNVTNHFHHYDTIFYDSFSPTDCIEKDSFLFFELSAGKFLRPGGRLTFWYPSNVLPEKYQRVLLQHFNSLSIHLVKGLEPTEECMKQGFKHSMIIPVAYK